MNEFSLKQSMNWRCLLVFSFVFSLFITENTYSRDHWNRYLLGVFYDQPANVVAMEFEFFDYAFGPANENGYLEHCNFQYSVDGVNFTDLMRAETDDQGHDNWSWLNMKYKLTGAQLQFEDCIYPPSGTMWPDSVQTQLVKVYNYESDRAWLTIKWFMDKTYHDILFIRINGKWHVNGIYSSDYFDEVYSVENYSSLKSNNLYDNSLRTKTKGNTCAFENKAVKVSKDTDYIVIKGAETGEKIKVYSTSGTEIKTIISNNDVMKIRLPVNQMYIVQVGESRYKISL